MKKYFTILLMALCTLCMQAQHSRNQYYLFVSSHTDLLGQWKVEVVDSIYFEEVANQDYVDLGLPSGTLWATCNVGADLPEELGAPFAWGETSTKTTFTIDTYKWYNNDEGYATGVYTKYVTLPSYGTVDHLTQLARADDAAHALWGGDWRMPSALEIKELLEECTWERTSKNGVEGYRITGLNGNRIFIPLGSDDMAYWTISSVAFLPYKAYTMSLSDPALSMAHRFAKGLVRPVFDANHTLNASTSIFEPDFNGYSFVDLGLPSGLLWASCNIGAATPDASGDLFAWGETSTKSNYDWSTYIHCLGSGNTMTKYCTSSEYGTVDNKTTLEPADDAAHVIWEGDWRMPTMEECEELIDNCTWVRTASQGACDGFLVTSKTNGNTLFLPNAGYSHGTILNDTARSNFYYWSSTLDGYKNADARAVYLDVDPFLLYVNRHYGNPVRPVCTPIQK